MVGRTPLDAFLARHTKISLDTSILLYFVQDHPRYGAACASLFERIERKQLNAMTSTVSLLEALVQPYRLQDEPLAEKFYGLLSTYPKLQWAPLTVEVADRAAELRARYRLSTPDAIQIASALVHSATGFLGNDKGLKKVQEIECLALDDIV